MAVGCDQMDTTTVQSSVAEQNKSEADWQENLPKNLSKEVYEKNAQDFADALKAFLKEHPAGDLDTLLKEFGSLKRENHGSKDLMVAYDVIDQWEETIAKEKGLDRTQKADAKDAREVQDVFTKMFRLL